MVSATQTTTIDVVNAILGVQPGDKIAELRDQKPVLAEELQTYYRAIFEPDATSSTAFPLIDRLLAAVRVASHTRSLAVANWYAQLAVAAGASSSEIERARDIARAWVDSSKLGAAIRHADLLTTNPSNARQSDLQALKNAGFTPAGILSLSQVVAFVSYQLRLIAGLRAFGDAI